ncbi:orotidine-5'-phosphate decarboxylase [Clostridium sardiniense]|uniref:Orotidine 5'-phosphate decarboxylase n=1 Tax=Clostridium sardiniense TaxID=29369 RepID=A0ABS7L094_CLOSR|nr:orotidine-5'-phosphate decarboxylase [Clostridium sardiniense]MBY0756485.1 orotidine-5'-phosphate decarboxylase [Clostridium sardiniense]MDQ0460226.1 orotidine-5'-phosphate decarboxylase [Clostridium sardiniense]
MKSRIIDKLYNRVNERGVVCVGLDTSLDYIPSFIKEGKSNKDAIVEFNRAIIDATFDVAACFKVQIAYYEALGIEGLEAYRDTLAYLREKGEIIIADIKRGDIAATATMYAKAHFEGDFEADFITLSPYMGMDSIEPYIPYIEGGDKGIFSLVRTSNKGAKDIEYIKTPAGRNVYDIVGEKVLNMGKEYMGECGYTPMGGVIGCTHIEEGAKIRETLKEMFFLIPGYGAQGGKAEDVAMYLNNGNGGVVNSSRGILLAYKNNGASEKDFVKCAREEVIRMRDEIRSACNR